VSQPTEEQTLDTEEIPSVAAVTSGEGEKESLLCSQTNIYEQQRLHIFTHYYGRGKKAVDRRFSSVLPTF